MNSLTLGFFFIVGLAWAFAETCIIAANGNWTPLILFLIWFTLMFSVLGCAKISENAVNRSGGIFALLLGVGLVLLAIHTVKTGTTGLAVLKGIFAVAYLVAGVISLLPTSKAAH